MLRDEMFWKLYNDQETLLQKTGGTFALLPVEDQQGRLGAICAALGLIGTSGCVQLEDSQGGGGGGGQQGPPLSLLGIQNVIRGEPNGFAHQLVQLGEMTEQYDNQPAPGVHVRSYQYACVMVNLGTDPFTIPAANLLSMFQGKGADTLTTTSLSAAPLPAVEYSWTPVDPNTDLTLAPGTTTVLRPRPDQNQGG